MSVCELCELTLEAGIYTPTSCTLQSYLNGPVAHISHGFFFSLLCILEITEVNFMA
jgi:hypothetical protein